VTLLADAGLRRACGARGLCAARAYDASVIAQRLDAVYQQLVASAVAATT
jgi:hypothetical protein